MKGDSHDAACLKSSERSLCGNLHGDVSFNKNWCATAPILSTQWLTMMLMPTSKWRGFFSNLSAWALARRWRRLYSVFTRRRLAMIWENFFQAPDFLANRQRLYIAIENSFYKQLFKEYRHISNASWAYLMGMKDLETRCMPKISSRILHKYYK